MELRFHAAKNGNITHGGVSAEVLRSVNPLPLVAGVVKKTMILEIGSTVFPIYRFRSEKAMR